jgi:hypothetical protein
MSGLNIMSFSATVDDQTKEFTERLNQIKSSRLVDSQKSGYQAVGLENYMFANTLLFGLYYCIVIAIIYRLYSSIKYSRNIKFIIILAIIMYPYVISSIEMRIYSFATYYYAIVTGNVYITGTGT